MIKELELIIAALQGAQDSAMFIACIWLFKPYFFAIIWFIFGLFILKTAVIIFNTPFNKIKTILNMNKSYYDEDDVISKVKEFRDYYIKYTNK